jgi:hypothetical protein
MSDRRPAWRGRPQSGETERVIRIAKTIQNETPLTLARNREGIPWVLHPH